MDKNNIIILILVVAVLVAVVAYFIPTNNVRGEKPQKPVVLTKELKKDTTQIEFSFLNAVKFGFGFGAGLFFWGLLMALIGLLVGGALLKTLLADFSLF